MPVRKANASYRDVTQVDAQHTFAAPPTQRQTLYQFVDIDDRDIQKLLVSDKKDCDVSDARLHCL